MAEDKEKKDVSPIKKSQKDQQSNWGAKAIKEDKPKVKKTFFWWAGVIILILISITLVLPATGLSALFSKNITFGTYNGEKIELTSDSYLYNQYYNLMMQYGGNNLDFSTMYQIWYQAYYSTVQHIALSQMAKDAGIIAVDKTTNNLILASGYYNNGDGVFDSELYNATDKGTRDSVYNSAKEQVPSMQVVNDIITIISSDAEKDFVTDLSASGRSFDYVSFDYSNYSDELAVEYLMSNPQPFTAIDLSVITLSSEEEAKALRSEVESGVMLFEQAVSSSIDSYSASAGAMDTLMYQELVSNFIGEESLNKVFGTAEGALSEVVPSYYGYSFFRVNAAPTMCDYTNADVLTRVKRIINGLNSTLTSEYASALADEFYAEAETSDFYTALDSLGYVETSVGATPANPASSQLLSSFTYTDYNGLMSSATRDSAYLASLYTSEEGTVLPPQAAGSAYIVSRVGADSTDSSTKNTMSLLYDYFVSSATDVDLSNTIVMNPNFEDNFYTTFFNDIYSF